MIATNTASELRLLVIATFWVLSIFLGPDTCKAADGDLIAAFKSHLEKRPVAVECAFSKKINLPNIPEAARQQTYFFRWQADAYYVQVIGQLDDIDVFDRGTMCGGRSGRVLWEKHAGELTTFNLDTNPTAPEKNPVYGQEFVFRKTVDMVLNLGITELEQQPVKWVDGALQFSDGMNGLITGSLKGTGKDTLELSLSNQRGLGAYAIIEYHFRENFAERKFPLRIVRRQRNQSGSFAERFDLNLLRYAPASVPFESSLMSVDRFVDPKARAIYSYSNSVLYSEDPREPGTATKVQTIEEIHASMPHPAPKRIKWELIAAVIIAVLALLLAVRKIKHK